jgi:hypothetical protein
MRASAVLLSAKLLTLGRMSKLFCFNGLYTPFTSPVLGGQKRLIAILYVRLSHVLSEFDYGRHIEHADNP